ncbi:MAG: hypothetical protein M1826_004717 [Phylliscum demangeonii]|nr:MAG: hypothetical protein M1826_004717 [Phylliscum demangeonii]
MESHAAAWISGLPVVSPASVPPPPPLAQPHPFQRPPITPEMAVVPHDAWLDDISRRMASSGLSRRRSTKRPGPWSTVRDSSRARVGKLHAHPTNVSAGSSPVSSLLPRRTSSSSAAASLRRYAPGLHGARPESAFGAPRDRDGARVMDDAAVAAAAAARPFSWHPTSQPAAPVHAAWPAPSMGPPRQGSWYGYGGGGTAYADYPSTPSLYACSENISPVLPISPLTTTTALDVADRDRAEMAAYSLRHSQALAAMPTSNPLPPPALLELAHDHHAVGLGMGVGMGMNMGMNLGMGMGVGMGMGIGVHYPSSSADFSPLPFLPSNGSPTPSSSAFFLPIQRPDPDVSVPVHAHAHAHAHGYARPPPHHHSGSGAAAAPRRPQLLEKEKEKELLVGISLYDDVCHSPIDPSFPTGGAAAVHATGSPYHAHPHPHPHPHHYHYHGRHPRPVGKGLKLEETWQPPGTSTDEEMPEPPTPMPLSILSSGDGGVRGGGGAGRVGALPPPPSKPATTTTTDEILGSMLESSFLLDDGCLFHDAYDPTALALSLDHAGVGSGNNYAYLVVDEPTQEAVIIDPANPAEVLPVLQAQVEAKKIRLKGIFNTHHHGDHAGGNREMLQHFTGLPVTGGADCDAVTRTPKNGEEFKIGQNISVTALHTPCHTQDSICYFVRDGDHRAVFTGDTLFIGGCGRFFEGTPEEMHAALNKTLAALPDDTKVYPGHEYTKANVKFAASVARTDPILKLQRFADAHPETQGQFTIGDEKDPLIQKATGKNTPVEVMAKLREMKNAFS